MTIIKKVFLFKKLLRFFATFFDWHTVADDSNDCSYPRFKRDDRRKCVSIKPCVEPYVFAFSDVRQTPISYTVLALIGPSIGLSMAILKKMFAAAPKCGTIFSC